MMNARYFFLLGLLTLAVVIPRESASAEASPSPGATGITGDITLTYKWSRDRQAQLSLFAKQLYFEKALVNGMSVFLLGFHDQEFKSAYFGFSKKLNDFQIGMGFGPARYNGVTHATFNPWIHYGDSVYEGLYSLERFGNESSTPWYHKGYFHRRLGSHIFGVYGEKDVGVGPMIGTYIGSNSRVWISVPAVVRPDVSKIRLIGGLVIEF